MTDPLPVPFLSPGWAEAVTTVSSTGAAPAGVDLSVDVDQVVTGGPDGDVVVRLHITEGRVTGCEVVAGKSAKAPVALTTTHGDALALVRGELDLNAAFMSGQMKVAGSTGLLLDVLAWSQRDEVSAWRSALAAATA